ncbi:MAG: 4-hydroxy-3-methylbut-2-enyl diphosphate reductase [Solobacterium sp.]|nr:4-hydroxy-3-methylbut-2-enyl diphosphate reductase [Solobacterium sp.]
MKIIPVVPRGYCQGVVRAIRIARETAEQYKGMPVCMLGMIVHNKYVVRECEALGIRFVEDSHKTRLELLDMIDEGVVIFTAHGVSDAVREKAERKGLITIDATCPDVLKTHDLIKEHCRKGDVIYIGKKGHPEADGALGLSDRVWLVTNESDVAALPDSLEHIMITNQTTLGILDTEKILAACLKRWPDALPAPEICAATRIRQTAVMDLKDTDVLIVVGDPHSNNTNQLKQIGLSSGIKHVYMAETCMDLKEEMIKDADTVAVTAGSSTPTILTSQVISFLQSYAETGEFTPPQIPDHVF